MKRGEKEEARITYRNVHRQNAEVWLESTMRVTRKDNGDVDGVVAISRDITEQKKLETQARDARDRGQPHRALPTAAASTSG